MWKNPWESRKYKQQTEEFPRDSEESQNEETPVSKCLKESLIEYFQSNLYFPASEDSLIISDNLEKTSNELKNLKQIPKNRKEVDRISENLTGIHNHIEIS